MNLYDKEERIIELMQYLELDEIQLFNDNKNTRKIVESIRNKEEWKKWVNSSGKSDLPPDFYNDSLKIMMDVMRIDDHAFVNEKGRVINPTNERESKLMKELMSKTDSLKEAGLSGRLIIIPDSGLRGKADHNYEFYVNNFSRVVSKHIENIPLYEKTHKGYKIIFFVFDESSPYIKCLDKRPKIIGESIYAQPHFWWNDYNMLKNFKKSNVDYLIWFSPYKFFRSEENIKFPQCFIFDVSKINFNRLCKYDKDEMESLEL